MHKTILLVEDNPTDEKLTTRAFRTCGVANTITVARDGVEALDYLFGTGMHAARTTSDLPAVVLLDLKLPRVDGLEVLRRLRANERTRLLPVVILTASAEEEDVERGYSLGANAYVRKPVEFAEFAEVARTLGHFWLVMNQRPPARRSEP